MSLLTKIHEWKRRIVPDGSPYANMMGLDGIPEDIDINKANRRAQSDQFSWTMVDYQITASSITDISEGQSFLLARPVDDFSYSDSQYPISYESYAFQSAPVFRLPFEILEDIFCLVLGLSGQTPDMLARVCREWRAVIVNFANVWATLSLSTWTKREMVEIWLERSRNWPLNIVIDTARDEENTRLGEPYEGLAFAFISMPRWRTLVVTSFPPEEKSGSLRQSISLGHMGGARKLESLVIGLGCQSSSVFIHLLGDIVAYGDRSHFTSTLTMLKLYSPWAIAHFSLTPRCVVFDCLTWIELDGQRTQGAFDILPHFLKVETFIARCLRIVDYDLAVPLPLVHTVRRLELRTVSIQWMAGRTFGELKHCAITTPLDPDSIRSLGVHLPRCTQVNYHNRVVDALNGFYVPELQKLDVGCNEWNRWRGGIQLCEIWFGGGPAHIALLPRVLHLKIECMDKALLYVLKHIPLLEELYLDLKRPSSLGPRFFDALVARSGNPRHSSRWANVKPLSSNEPTICPHLRILGLRYERWRRESEADQILSILISIVLSRRLIFDRVFKLRLRTSTAAQPRPTPAAPRELGKLKDRYLDGRASTP